MKDIIKEIIIYMDTHASSGIKIEELAAIFGYSKFHFSREFKKITGISPKEYLAGVKIEKSIHSLILKESVINSQLDAGYSSSGTFTRTFSKNTGLSPRDYVRNLNLLFETVKQHEIIDEDSDSLFFRNPEFPTVVAPYKLTVHLVVPSNFKGIIFTGLFLKPNPNHQPVMGRCRVKDYTYEFYHLPEGTYFPLSCGIKTSSNLFRYFRLAQAMRACDGQSITFPLTKNEELTIKLREKKISDPPILVNLPNILANGIKQQIGRNKRRVAKKIKK